MSEQLTEAQWRKLRSEICLRSALDPRQSGALADDLAPVVASMRADDAREAAIGGERVKMRAAGASFSAAIRLRGAIEALADQILAELLARASDGRGEPTTFERNIHAELRELLERTNGDPS